MKTLQFGQDKYVGDPLNAVRIFNEKEADEMIVLDIDATVLNSTLNYSLIKNLAAECRMPLCYGGGVKEVDQIKKIIGLGVEKVAVSSAAIDNPRLVSEGANRVGSQSIVVVMDVRKKTTGTGYDLCTHNATRVTGICPKSFARQMEESGAGELVINSIDRDGTMKGFDLDLICEVRDGLTIPMTVLGGAGSLSDIGNLYKQFGVVGAAAGSIFVFKGKYKAVLINYPDQIERDSIFASNNT